MLAIPTCVCVSIKSKCHYACDVMANSTFLVKQCFSCFLHSLCLYFVPTPQILKLLHWFNQLDLFLCKSYFFISSQWFWLINYWFLTPKCQGKYKWSTYEHFFIELAPIHRNLEWNSLPKNEKSTSFGKCGQF